MTDFFHLVEEQSSIKCGFWLLLIVSTTNPEFVWEIGTKDAEAKTGWAKYQEVPEMKHFTICTIKTSKNQVVHAHPDPTLTTALEWNIANLFAMEQDFMICVLDKNGHFGKHRASIILDISRVNMLPGAVH